MPDSAPRKPSLRSTTGVRGVHHHRLSGKFAVAVMVRGVRHHLGLYSSLEEAAAVAAAAYSGELPLVKNRPAFPPVPSRPDTRWANPLPEAELMRLRRLAGGAW